MAFTDKKRKASLEFFLTPKKSEGDQKQIKNQSLFYVLFKNATQLNTLIKPLFWPNFLFLLPDPRSLHFYIEKISRPAESSHMAWLLGVQISFLCVLCIQKIHNNRLITFVQLPRRKRFYGDSIKINIDFISLSSVSERRKILNKKILLHIFVVSLLGN